MKCLLVTLSFAIVTVLLIDRPITSFAGAGNTTVYTITPGAFDQIKKAKDHARGYRDSYTNRIEQGIPKMAADWIPFASESSPRLYNWIDKKGIPHAANDPSDAPKDVVEKLNDKPEGTWVDQQGNVRTLEERIGKGDLTSSK